MEEIFIQKIKVNHVRNIVDLEIPLADDKRTNLILTGKNGSGKTSLLELIARRIGNYLNTDFLQLEGEIKDPVNIFIEKGKEGELRTYYNQGDFLFKIFNAVRNFDIESPEGIKKIEFAAKFDIDAEAKRGFLQHLVNLRAQRSFANDDQDLERMGRIDRWFQTFENSLQDIFENPELKLQFNRENYTFQIIEEDKNPYSLSELSAGYGAILDIYAELIMRMKGDLLKSTEMQGIVLIDEIETHLHVDLQKKILPFLTNLFPKIQFIVTTHSPFVLNSIENAVICDLEKRIVTTNLSGYSYEALIESYFDTDKFSNELKEKIARYESLLSKEQLTDEEEDELEELEQYVTALPTFKADELVLKLQQLKLNRLKK